mgnify:FL=1
MDGELVAEEAKDVIEQLKKKNGLYYDWETYHLIGDSLRQSSRLSIDVSKQVSEQLTSEPAILIPTVPAKEDETHKRRNYALSIAASIVVVLAGWLGLQTLQEPSQVMVADNHMENTMPVIPVVGSASPTHLHSLTPAEFNDYLFVHGEFSPGTATHGPSIYLHQVTDHQDR